MTRTVVIIPARMASTRFPGKPLADATGKPMIQHVYERAARARGIDLIAIATDDQRILDAAQAFSARALITRTDHPNGTSRLAEAADRLGLTDRDLVVNVQGDEPELEPVFIERGVEALRSSAADVATIAVPAGPQDRENPHVVKVVCRGDGRAMYFSRAAIPFPRDGANNPGGAETMRHVGLYVYRRTFLTLYRTIAPTPLEQTEQLEQLRMLEAGFEIAVAVVRGVPTPAGIDTPEQYQDFVARYRLEAASRG